MRVWEAILVTLVDAIPLFIFLFTLLVLKGVLYMMKVAILDIYRIKVEMGEEPGKVLSFFHSRIDKHEKRKERYNL